MQTILNEQKSSVGSPYVFYTVKVEPSNRTTNEVDLYIEVTSHLQYSSSSLGTGSAYGIYGYLEVNGSEKQLTLKPTNESWSGTTNHTVSSTFKISGLEPTATSIPDVKFRAIRSNFSTKNAGYLSPVSCDNITIPQGHTLPIVAITSIQELNTQINVPNTTFVQYLSQKRFTLSATAYEGATITGYQVVNGNNSASSITNVVDLDIEQLNIITNLVPVDVYVSDSFNTTGKLTQNYANYILYERPTINPTATITKRDGQTSGKVKLSFTGTFYNGDIGENTNTPVVKYRYWEKDTEEPTSWETIPNTSYTISNNNITITDYQIGSTIITDPNYFDYQKAYSIRIQINDNYYATNTLKGITVGEALWSEYKDRVDFKSLSIKGKNIMAQNILWEDDEGYYMFGGQTINLSEKVSEQKNGIVLVWQGYTPGSGVQGYWMNYTFVPKYQVAKRPSYGVSCFVGGINFEATAVKYVYINDDSIAGNNNNTSTGTYSSIDYEANRFVLVAVIGV